MNGGWISSAEGRDRSLWMLTVSPTVWALHFLIAYGTAAVWCARYAQATNPLGPVRAAIVVYTVVALGIIGATGLWGWRTHRRGGASLPHDDDTPEDRWRFMGFATFLLSGLSAVAVIFAALVIVFVETCQ